jgi:hypothetical protein
MTTNWGPQRRVTNPEPVGSGTKSFLDTSIAIKLRVGHPKHRAYLLAAIPALHYVNNYVRMEFYRALLVDWVNFYFECASPFHSTFSDALAFCSDHFGRKPKAYLNAIAKMLASAGFAVDSPAEKEVCLHKLEDIIFVMARAFELDYKDLGADPTACARIRSPLRISDTEDRRKTLSEFGRLFRDTEACRACRAIQKFFLAGKYATQMRAVEQISEPEEAHPTLKKIASAVQKANQDPSSLTCSLCERIGDAVIAISVPAGWKLHTLDTVHEPICQALGKEFQVHPSAARLKALEEDGH